MFISYAVLALMCYYRPGSSFNHDNVCHYNLDYKCTLLTEKNKTSIYPIKKCSIEDIPKNVTFNIMYDDNNSSSQGIVNVNFKPPSLQCKHNVVLFVNPYINNIDDCKKYEFKKDNHAEIHTVDKTICPKYDNQNHRRELETEIPASACKENSLNIWYEYIYTGCYSLAFKAMEKYIFMSNDYLKTDYEKVEVTEPKLRCTYKANLKETDSSVEIVTLAADISLLAGSSGLKLEVAPTPLLYKNEKNSCNRFIDKPIINFLMEMNMDQHTDFTSKNCSLTTSTLHNGDTGKTIECNFIIQNSNKDVGYCFFVHILDERCHINTSWKPPLIDKTNHPCTWSQHCTKTEVKSTTTTEEIKNNGQILNIPKALYLILSAAILLVILAVFSTIFIVYRMHNLCKKNSSNNKIKKDFIDDGNTVFELSATLSQKEKLVKETGIVILYPRESDEFMNFMAEFRKTLKQHTSCDVHDWWAPDLWNDVARVGGYEWVVKMIKKDCRVVWVDTLKARTLFAVQHKNGYDKSKRLKNNWHSHHICDFRDSVFPAIVDFAKRNNHDIDQEYQRHFVIRLETFKNADMTLDPFADLSPHVRFLIPCHLDKLCSQLSMRELYLENEMKVEKVHLGRYLPEEPFTHL